MDTGEEVEEEGAGARQVEEREGVKMEEVEGEGVKREEVEVVNTEEEVVTEAPGGLWVPAVQVPSTLHIRRLTPDQGQ